MTRILTFHSCVSADTASAAPAARAAVTISLNLLSEALPASGGWVGAGLGCSSQGLAAGSLLGAAAGPFPPLGPMALAPGAAAAAGVPSWPPCPAPPPPPTPRPVINTPYLLLSSRAPRGLDDTQTPRSMRPGGGRGGCGGAPAASAHTLASHSATPHPPHHIHSRPQFVF